VELFTALRMKTCESLAKIRRKTDAKALPLRCILKLTIFDILLALYWSELYEIKKFARIKTERSRIGQRCVVNSTWQKSQEIGAEKLGKLKHIREWCLIYIYNIYKLILHMQGSYYAKTTINISNKV
jgi:hypothetical protein